MDGIIDLQSGNMKRAEAMLYAQAQAVQAIFMNFSRRALKQEYQKNRVPPARLLDFN